MDFPTANIEVGFKQKLIPEEGIYAVKVKVRKSSFGGMLNIGYRPTFNGTQKRIEVHIFDFDQNIYGDSIVVEFYRKIRSEIKFESLESLKEQLFKDKIEAQLILKNII